MVGGTGDDRLTSGGGQDVLHGGGGNDTLVVGTGGGTFDGGADVDTISFAGITHGVTVDLRGADRSGGGPVRLGDDAGDRNVARLRNVENVIGTAHDDRLTGDDGANRLDGGGGADRLDGGGGRDAWRFWE